MTELIEFEKEYVLAKWNLKQEQKRLHKNFVKEHRGIFVFLDIAVVLIVLMNFGALFITDFMVASRIHEVAKEEGTEVVYREVNPTAAAIHNFDSVEPGVGFPMLFSFMKQMILWSIPIIIYIYYRSTVYTWKAMFIIIAMIVYSFYMLGGDFVHDLALLIAKLRYG